MLSVFLAVAIYVVCAMQLPLCPLTLEIFLGTYCLYASISYIVLLYIVKYIVRMSVYCCIIVYCKVYYSYVIFLMNLPRVICSHFIALQLMFCVTCYIFLKDVKVMDILAFVSF